VSVLSTPTLRFYWRGRIELVDGSHSELVILEDQTVVPPTYVVALRGSPGPRHPAAEDLATLECSSARIVLITAERTLNDALYRDHMLVKPSFEPEQFWI